MLKEKTFKKETAGDEYKQYNTAGSIAYKDIYYTQGVI